MVQRYQDSNGTLSSAIAEPMTGSEFNRYTNHLYTKAEIGIISEIFVVLVLWAIITQYENQGKTTANLYYTNIWRKSRVEY